MSWSNFPLAVSFLVTLTCFFDRQFTSANLDSSTIFFLEVGFPYDVPGSGSPSPVEVAPAGLCRVVASFFSAPGSGSPSPVEVAPAGLCRVVASLFSAPGSGLVLSGLVLALVCGLIWRVAVWQVFYYLSFTSFTVYDVFIWHTFSSRIFVLIIEYLANFSWILNHDNLTEFFTIFCD